MELTDIFSHTFISLKADFLARLKKKKKITCKIFILEMIALAKINKFSKISLDKEQSLEHSCKSRTHLGNQLFGRVFPCLLLKRHIVNHLTFELMQLICSGTFIHVNPDVPF